MFDSVLIANRGEIAVRILRTLKRLRIESIAVFSDEDANAPHVHLADRAVRIGRASAADSYLDVGRIVAAAQQTGAQAVHPGYGFLSERADFAEACLRGGLAFVGPSPAAIALLGDKAAAKQAAAAAGVPVVPGLSGESLTDEEILGWAQDQALPLLLKAAGGGGGRGMRVVRRIEDLQPAIEAARHEAHAAFGDERLIIERFIGQARHIEVQVIADCHRNVLHLGERECSLQRRHQKVIEECPSPAVDEPLRQRLGEAAVALAKACEYTNAGTVELLADRDDPQRFYFLEMNARLQVEHPVTEAVTGLDLVELQLRIAAGEPLQVRQQDVRLDGHAIEARIYAEDPANGFLPSTGRVELYREPDEVRFDSGIAQGSAIGSHYDPLLAKAIAHGPNRETAIESLQAALRQTRVLGGDDRLVTNLPWLRALLSRPEVREGNLDTTLIERLGPAIESTPADCELLAGVALVALLCHRSHAQRGGDPWQARDGWRIDEPAEAWMRLSTAAGEVDALAIPGDDGEWRIGTARVSVIGEQRMAVETADGARRVVETHHGLRSVWLIDDGVPHWYAQASRRAAHHAGADSLQAPMPGVVLEVRAPSGASVQEGDVLVVLESMKMELSVASPEDGVVGAVHVAVGDRVSQGQALLELGAA